MAFSIPSGIFNTYYEVVDELIDNIYIGKTITLVFAPISVSCANCTTVHFGGVSKNVYAHGGPAPFSLGDCPICGGNGFRQDEVTDTIRARVYYRAKDWIVVSNIRIPDADAQIIGYKSDLAKLKRAESIKIADSTNSFVWRCQLAGEPFLHGFGDRYFVGFIKRV